jgi:hypothetical protein
MLKKMIESATAVMEDNARFIDKVRKSIDSLRAEGKNGLADEEARFLRKLETNQDALRKAVERMQKSEAKRNVA